MNVDFKRKNVFEASHCVDEHMVLHLGAWIWFGWHSMVLLHCVSYYLWSRFQSECDIIVSNTIPFCENTS